MTSTELNLGLPSKNRPSSRVLKPPGGGHSDIFGGSEVKANPPRPKYDQQNSSNLNCVMNTVDPNEAVQKTREEIEKIKQPSEIEKQKDTEKSSSSSSTKENDKEEQIQGRGRVPPGGFSSGFW